MAERNGELISTTSAIKLVIKTPAEINCFSRGFYQVDEDFLSVPIYPGGRFYSYLDSPQLSFDISDNGHLLSIQILLPRSNWIKRGDLNLPQPSPAADIRFVDFRGRLPEAIIESNFDCNLIHIQFAVEEDIRVYRVSDTISFEVTADETLAGVWIDGSENDRAAYAQGAWLKRMKENNR